MSGVIVPLDVASAAEAWALVDRLGPAAEFFKVGLELYTREGPDVVRALRGRGKRVFLDLKFHDIPQTVSRAVSAAAACGADLLTVHTLGGRDMMEAASAARDAAADAGLRLLGVTVLTSHPAAEVEASWGRTIHSLRDEVLRLATHADESGLDGVVASPLEAAALRRAHGPSFLIVTPGVRPEGASRDDQSRFSTPAAARDAGADYLVIGRPITRAPDPRDALERILAELAGGGGPA